MRPAALAPMIWVGEPFKRSTYLHGVDTSCVAVIDRPTGQVLVKLDVLGRASYEFAADAAWDHVAWSDGLQQLAARADAICFSTLGQRSEVSRQTIQRFVGATPAKCLRVLDINLRPPFWNEAIVMQSLQLANVLKVNDAELSVRGHAGLERRGS
jgi:fructokinase